MTLQLGTAHARARDAVHLPLDTAALMSDLTAAGFSYPTLIRSAAPDRATYLSRPDLGRQPAPGTRTRNLRGIADVAVVICDGLSSAATQHHAVPLLTELRAALPPPTSLADPVVCVQARVALGDYVANAIGAPLLLVLIGERPGLSAHDSLGAYLTWRPQPGRTTDADRWCVSNIRPGGLRFDVASVTLADLISVAIAERRTGVTTTRPKRTIE